MRKILNVFVAFVVLIAMATGIFAHSINTIPQNQNSIYVSTPQVPTDVVEFAKREVAGHMDALALADKTFEKTDELAMGTPFTYIEKNDAESQFYFPIIHHNTIIGFFRVYEDTAYYEECGTLRYGGSLSAGGLADIFMDSAQNTSYTSPISLLNTGSSIAIKLNQTIEVFASDPLANIEQANVSIPDIEAEFSSLQNSRSLELTTVDIMNKIEYTYSPIVQLSTSYPSNGFTGLYITEGQSGNSWCNAYAVATIIRSHTFDAISAQDIASYFNLSSSEGLSVPRAILYAENEYNMSPVSYAYRLYHYQIQEEITDGRPILGIFDRGAASHALVICGYSSTAYTVWNPWNGPGGAGEDLPQYETFSRSTMSYSSPISSYVYSWDYGAYNWV